jgi:hypothetical protein
MTSNQATQSNPAYSQLVVCILDRNSGEHRQWAQLLWKSASETTCAVSFVGGEVTSDGRGGGRLKPEDVVGASADPRERQGAACVMPN